MKIENLPIWPRILARRATIKTTARSPIGILRAVLAAGGLQKKHRTVQPAFVPRAKRFTDFDRDTRRAAADKKFARVLKARRAAEAKRRALVLHIAERYHSTVRRLYTSQYASIVWAGSAHQNVEWDRYAKSYKYPCKYSDAGAIMDASGITISPTNDNQIRLPLPAPALIRAANLTEPHPIGLFAVPVKGQPGVFACLSPRHLTPALSPSDAEREKKAAWVVAGFSVRGRRVPECVARGTTTLADIAAETNSESRQIMIERFGLERYLAGAGATEIDHSDVGTLYDIAGLRVVKVVNSTPEPDGSYKDYFLKVPPGTATAQAAVAWTFGLQAEEYTPAMQS